MAGTKLSSDASTQPRKEWVPAWSSLRLVGSTMAVRATILIPFIGYWILFNEHFLGYTRIVISPNASDPTPYFTNIQRLYFSYFGLSILGVASFLFQLKCPEVVKRFRGIQDFTRSEVEYFSVLRLVDLAEQIRNHCSLRQAKLRGDLVRLMNAIDLTEEHLKHKDIYCEAMRKHADAYKHDVTQLFFKFEDKSMPRARFTIYFLFSIGFILLAIPSLDIFLTVVREFIRTMRLGLL